MNGEKKYVLNKREEFIQYMYLNTDMFPTSFEDCMDPVATYGRNGKIYRATKIFRELAEITQDDIRSKKVNIFELLNNENKGLIEAAHSVFDDKGITVKDLVRPLRVNSNVAIAYSSKYTEAVFFPMTHSGDTVEYGAVLLISQFKIDDELEILDEEADEETPEPIKKKTPRKYSRILSIAAACLAVAIIGTAGLIKLLDHRPDYIALSDDPVPLAAPLMIDEHAKPYTGAEPEGVTGETVKVHIIKEAAIPANTADVKMFLLNPEGNACNLTFEITEGDETLYKSGLVEPGKCIEDIKLSKGLAQGEYKALLIIRTYASDSLTQSSSVKIEFDLTVKPGDATP